MNNPWHSPPRIQSLLSHCPAVSSTVNDRAAHIIINWECRKGEERRPPLPGCPKWCSPSWWNLALFALPSLMFLILLVFFTGLHRSLLHGLFLYPPPPQTCAHVVSCSWFPVPAVVPVLPQMLLHWVNAMDFSQQNSFLTWVWREFSQLN